MGTPEVKVKRVLILKRGTLVTTVKVHCEYEGGKYDVFTEIGSGNDLPSTTLEGFAVPPSDEFITALHLALNDNPVVWEEVRRINENVELIT